MNYEDMEVEVTCELIGFISNDLGYECHQDDVFGRPYLKVYGDQYRDLSRFLREWRNHRPNSPMLDICNISSQGYWYCSVITNWNKLNLDTQRRIMSLN